MGLAAWLVVASVVSGAATPDAPAPRLTEVRDESDASLTHLVVLGPTEYDYQSADIRAVVVDFPGWDGSAIIGPLPVRAPWIASARVSGGGASGQPPFTRIEILLAADCVHRIFVKDEGVHLMLQPLAQTPAPPPPTPTLEPPAAPTAAPTTPPAAASPLPTEPPVVEPPVAAPVAEPPAAEAPPVEPAGSDAAESRPVARILTIQSEEREGRLALIVEGSRPLTPRAFRLDKPERLVVDLPDAILPASFRRQRVTTAGVARVRIAQLSVDPSVVRVVADLSSAGVPYDVVKEEGDRRIVIWIGVRAP
jgi:hypothetical protein